MTIKKKKILNLGKKEKRREYLRNYYRNNIVKYTEYQRNNISKYKEYRRNYHQKHYKQQISDRIKKELFGTRIQNIIVSYYVNSAKYNKNLNNFVIKFKYNNQKCIATTENYDIHNYIYKNQIFIKSAIIDIKMYNANTFLVNNLVLSPKNDFSIDKRTVAYKNQVLNNKKEIL